MSSVLTVVTPRKIRGDARRFTARAGRTNDSILYDVFEVPGYIRDETA